VSGVVVGIGEFLSNKAVRLMVGMELLLASLRLLLGSVRTRYSLLVSRAV